MLALGMYTFLPLVWASLVNGHTTSSPCTHDVSTPTRTTFFISSFSPPLTTNSYPYFDEKCPSSSKVVVIFKQQRRISENTYPSPVPDEDANSFKRGTSSIQIDLSHHMVPEVISEMPRRNKTGVHRPRRRRIGALMLLLLG